MARSVREIDRNEDKYVGIEFPLDHSPEGFFYNNLKQTYETCY